MESVQYDTGLLPNSKLFHFTPSETAKELYFYPTWCGHYFCTSHYYYKREFYEPLLVMYVREGVFHIEYDGYIFDAHKGDVILLDCTHPHYYHAQDGLEFVFLHFDGSNSHELCARILDMFGPLIRNANNPLIGNYLYQLVQFYERDGVETLWESSMRVYKLLHLLGERDSYQPKETSPIEKAIRYIRNNVGKKITLSELAEIANLSPYYFSHRFKEETGVSPIEYAINTRIDLAKALLIRTSKSIEEIAFEVGYQNSSTLIKLFIRKAGMTPKSYRKHYFTS